jgi:hypothetical protein
MVGSPVCLSSKDVCFGPKADIEPRPTTQSPGQREEEQTEGLQY